MVFSGIIRSAVVALFSGAVALGHVPAAQALVISGSSSAYGESVVVADTLGFFTVTSGPLPSGVSGSAPPPYDLGPTSFAGVTVVGAAGPAATLFETGILTASASSNVDGTGGAKFASANATVDGLTAGSLLVSLFLGTDLTLIEASATVSGDAGALVATGGATIAGATLVIGGISIDLSGSATANTVAFDSLGLRVVLNEQITGGDGVNSRSFLVNAIHVSFNDFGAGLLDGDIIISQAQAQLAAVPVPGTLALLGLALAGVGFCRRKLS